MSLKEKIKIMVVDDMSTSRGLVIQALEMFGIKNIQYASNGKEAFDLLLSNPAHLILPDYNMPGIDGIDLLKLIRNHNLTKNSGFILITGKADRALIEKGRALGMNNFIKKPFTNAELKACIETVAGKIF